MLRSEMDEGGRARNFNFPTRYRDCVSRAVSETQEFSFCDSSLEGWKFNGCGFAIASRHPGDPDALLSLCVFINHRLLRLVLNDAGESIFPQCLLQMCGRPEGGFRDGISR